jgi:hypothetical protein
MTVYIYIYIYIYIYTYTHTHTHTHYNCVLGKVCLSLAWTATSAVFGQLYLLGDSVFSSPDGACVIPLLKQ